MKREIVEIRQPGSCCPGHDDFPGDTYRNNRSKRARARGIKREHRYVRRIKKTHLQREVNALSLGETE